LRIWEFGPVPRISPKGFLDHRGDPAEFLHQSGILVGQ
jgi:hypothetical protein